MLTLSNLCTPLSHHKTCCYCLEMHWSFHHPMRQSQNQHGKCTITWFSNPPIPAFFFRRCQYSGMKSDESIIPCTVKMETFKNIESVNNLLSSCCIVCTLKVLYWVYISPMCVCVFSTIQITRSFSSKYSTHFERFGCSNLCKKTLCV